MTKQTPDRLSFDVSQHRFQLANGLRGVVLERPGMPVHVRVAFKAGSRYDPVGKEGLAHFLEHMLVAGTERYPTKTDLATYIEAYGGVFGARTPKEEILLNAAVGDPADLNVAFDVLGQMLGHSLFTDAAVDSERQSVLGEIGDWEANPSQQIYDLKYHLYFQDSVVGRSGVGTVNGVKAITKPDILEFLARTLTPDRGLVVVSGGVMAGDVRTAAEHHLGNLKPTEHDLDDGILTAKRLEPVLIEPKPNQQIRLSFGFRTCPIGHSDNPALDVIVTILGGGRASSLTRILRQERGLVYSVWAMAHEMAAGGTWTVETSAPKAKLQAVLDATSEEFGRVYSGGLTETELRFAIAKTVKSAKMNLQTSLAWVDHHTRYSLHLNSDWSYIDYLGQIGRVSLADLKRVGAKYFAPGSWYLGLIGDVKPSDFSVNYQ